MKDLNYDEAQRNSIKAATFYVIDKVIDRSGLVNRVDLAYLDVKNSLGLTGSIRDISDRLVMDACNQTSMTKTCDFSYIRGKTCGTLKWQQRIIDRRTEYRKRRDVHLALNTTGGLAANRGLK